MSIKAKNQSRHKSSPLKVISDFGGRRTVLDRRLKALNIDHRDRRSGKDRRSGFDRRSTWNQSNDTAVDHRQSALDD